MANEHIQSLHDAQLQIAELKKQIAERETQMKELQNRYPSFVDNPSNNLNKPVTINKETVLYFPTLDKNRHFGMKFEDVCKHFDQYHYPLYFTDEESCSIFDSIFPVLGDLIKFKVTYESGANTVPSRGNSVYSVYFNVENNRFEFESNTDKVLPIIYFNSIEVAKNCCTWLNYKYNVGIYKNINK